ncbi:chitinase [Amycolatopsis antarctica]|uniref:Chitinase n=1 Tax=Amycolatopsis antarctica TaxID=1854586 RepID=A0A263D642_9PSEU|nr:chitinase [Amycolatopsis antarctica]OZM73508.1 chitinase [Amycolatopsis antarctica]
MPSRKTLLAAIAAASLLTGGLSVTAAAAAPAPADPAPSAAAVPNKHLTGYWQNFVNPATPQKLSEVSDNFDVIVLSFAGQDTSRPGGITFGVDPELSTALGGYTDDDLKADIEAKKAAGKSVVLAIGGERGNVDFSSPESVTNFAADFSAIAADYGIQGLDIDLEHGFDVPNVAAAVTQLREEIGEGFLLTMAPQTIDLQPTGTYMQLIAEVKDLVTVVHPQFYNSGSMNGCDGSVVAQGDVDFITAQACLLLDVLEPEQVSLGLPATSQAAGSGYVEPSIVIAALDCLTKGESCGDYKPETTWPGLGGVMTWSTAWDAGSGNSFSDPIRAHLDALG